MSLKQYFIEMNAAVRLLDKIYQQWFQIMQNMRNDQRKAEEKLYEEVLGDCSSFVSDLQKGSGR